MLVPIKYLIVTSHFFINFRKVNVDREQKQKFKFKYLNFCFLFSILFFSANKWSN